MRIDHPPLIVPDAPLLTPPDQGELYRTTLEALNRSGVPYLVGGTYAFQYYSGIARSTKDFDIFVRPRDVRRVLEVLERAGFRTEMAFSHWLAKAHHGDSLIDVIFSSGNAVAEVDDEWFAHAVDKEILGIPVKLCPAEEMIWSKALIMERERYDGADVAHLLRHCSGLLNWDRLIRRFGPHWRVLLSHLVLFGFIYPGERALIPAAAIKELGTRLLAELDVPTRDSKVCQGTLLSRSQFLVDLEEWGYEDARLQPRGRMTPEQLAEWTAAIDRTAES
ncbi:MAG TPA: nucleotidyltransferase [Vicinamibacterales bacterium]|nr:nucleotidyltransferase [Vicinamibacterales bacterium]